MKGTSIVVSQSLVRASQEAFRGLLAAVDVDAQIRSRDRFFNSTLLESNQSESGFSRTLSAVIQDATTLSRAAIGASDAADIASVALPQPTPAMTVSVFRAHNQILCYSLVASIATMRGIAALSESTVLIEDAALQVRLDATLDDFAALVMSLASNPAMAGPDRVVSCTWKAVAVDVTRSNLSVATLFRSGAALFSFARSHARGCAPVTWLDARMFVSNGSRVMISVAIADFRGSGGSERSIVVPPRLGGDALLGGYRYAAALALHSAQITSRGTCRSQIINSSVDVSASVFLEQSSSALTAVHALASYSGDSSSVANYSLSLHESVILLEPGNVSSIPAAEQPNWAGLVCVGGFVSEDDPDMHGDQRFEVNVNMTLSTTRVPVMTHLARMGQLSNILTDSNANWASQVDEVNVSLLSEGTSLTTPSRRDSRSERDRECLPWGASRVATIHSIVRQPIAGQSSSLRGRGRRGDLERG